MPRGVAAAAVLHVFVAGLASGALAQTLHLDIALQENAADGRLSVHGFDFGVLPQLGIALDRRVFGRSFAISGSSLFNDDPGFVSRISSAELTPETGLIPVLGGQGLYFNILPAPSIFPELGGRNLSFWDGTGAVAWSAVPDDEALKIFKGPFFNPTDEAVADGSTTEVEGFLIGGTLGSGSLHEHIKFLLLPDGLTDPPAGPDDGVYLMLLELQYPAYAEWIPTWLMFKAFAGGQPTLDAAIADVEANFQLPLCDDGIDNDKDGLLDMDDPGCASTSDMSERGGDECDDGLDNDGDGRTDFDPVTFADGPSYAAGLGDPGCKTADWQHGESPQCSDGNNNDNEEAIDFDGGAAVSASGTLCTGAGTPFDCCTGVGTGCDGVPDAECAGKPWKNNEQPRRGCGLGFELVLILVPLFHVLQRRNRRDPLGLAECRRRPS